MTNCSVCGSSDLNLQDGYFYCVECGTQDANVRETMFVYNDNKPDVTGFGLSTYGIRLDRKKVKTVVKTKKIEMSGEWHKWHAFNFTLHGMADELIALGAKPSFKMKVLWIWTRYIKKYQNKDKFGVIKRFDDRCTSKFEDREESNKSDEEQCKENENKKRKKPKVMGRDNGVQNVTHTLFLSILYIALNLDKSDIQLSHILRFVSEHRITRYNFKKYIPKDINTKTFPEWQTYMMTCINSRVTPKTFRELILSCFKKLDLGTPLVPDLRKLLDCYIKELCLPNEFKNLVFSLMHLAPCDFLELRKVGRRAMRVPDYEAVVLSYVVIALKMCFGLDGDYEVKLSKVVDEINNKENYGKSYKIDMDPERTGRLFSFHKWCNYLQLREKMLCKYYLPMSRTFALPCDYYAFIQQIGARRKQQFDLNAQLTMDIINKIPLNNPPTVLRKDFPATLFSLTEYTEVILKYIQDPEIKMLLSEDFTQYSLKYACEDLKLPLKLNDQENLIKGVSELHKRVNPCIIGFLDYRVADMSMVYVRNCDNKNWLKTNPPTEKHVKTDDSVENTSDQEDDNYCKDDKTTHKVDGNEDVLEIDEKFELIINSEEVNIYDDMFEDIPTQDEVVKKEIEFVQEPKEFEFVQEPEVFIKQEPQWFDVPETEDSKLDLNLNIESTDTSDDDDENQRPQFDPDTFDRTKTIKELILLACKEYKIPIPREYKDNKTPKRKMTFDGQSAPKRSKRECPKYNVGEISTKNIVSTYYDCIRQDVLQKVAEEVKSAINNSDAINNKLIHENTPNDNELVENEYENAINDESIINNDESDIVIEQDTVVCAEEQNEDLSDDKTDEEVDVKDLLPKINPNFDGKTHKTKQLYVKCKPQNENAFFEEVMDIKSQETDSILQEKWEKFDCENFKNVPAQVYSDSDDELPLSLLKEELRYQKERSSLRKATKEHLIKNRKDIKEFKYWIRQYERNFHQHLEKGVVFDTEMLDKYPMSFRFVISKCGNILDRTPFFLLRCMEVIENKMLNYLK